MFINNPLNNVAQKINSSKARSVNINQSVQYGVSIIEALVALLILALGVLGLAGVQARALVEARTATSRSIAVRLVDDINERMQLNGEGVKSNSYTLAFGPAPTGVDCLTINCTPAQLAAFDLNQWRNNVASLLPGGNARIFQSTLDNRQIGVMLAWNANEGKANSNSDLVDAAYTAPLTVTANNGAIACPAQAICHLVYIQPDFF